MTVRWPGRLRVAVPRQIERWSPATGHGRVWHSVLPVLARRVRLHQVGDRGRRPLRRPDVWLDDGHEEPAAIELPLVVQIHEAGWLDPDVRPYLPDELVARLAGPTERAARAASAIITPSQWARRTVVDAGLAPAERVHAVLHGVDTDVFSPERADPQRVGVLLPALDGRPYVLFVGHSGPRKNLGALREAMAGLAGSGFPHALVVVAGAVPGRDDQASLASEARADLPGAPGRVLPLDEPDDRDLAAVMAGAAALCLPSHAEGFGLPVLEAMASGAPVVVSDRGALPEVAAGAGIVVEPTAEAVRAGLEQVLGDDALADRLRAAGRERALGLPWERTAEGWLTVLRDGAARGGATLRRGR